MAHLVLGETLLADRLEFTLPRAALSTRSFPSIEAEAKAACQYVGIELEDYEVYQQLMWVADERRIMLCGRREVLRRRDQRG